MDNRTSGIDDFHHVYIMFSHLNLHLQRIFHDFPIFSQDVPIKPPWLVGARMGGAPPGPPGTVVTTWDSSVIRNNLHQAKIEPNVGQLPCKYSMEHLLDSEFQT